MPKTSKNIDELGPPVHLAQRISIITRFICAISLCHRDETYPEKWNGSNSTQNKSLLNHNLPDTGFVAVRYFYKVNAGIQ